MSVNLSVIANCARASHIGVENVEKIILKCSFPKPVSWNSESWLMQALSCYVGVRLQVSQVPTYIVPRPGTCLLLSKTNIVGRPAIHRLFSVNIMFRGFKLYGYNLGIRSCWKFLPFFFFSRFVF